MSKLTRGPWQLRFLTIHKENNVLSFLTSNGVGNVVTVEPGIQPEKQIWFAVPIHEKKYYYKIIQDPASENPSGLAQVKGSNKVILSYSPGEWRLEEVPVAEIVNGDVYTIHPPPGRLPVVQFLGKEGHEVVIDTTSNPAPAWQFLLPIPE